LGQALLRIVAAALKLRQERFVIDGEADVLRPDGISDFDALASSTSCFQ
jgi:bifunctional non-homologous end joining protein LigD